MDRAIAEKINTALRQHGKENGNGEVENAFSDKKATFSAIWNLT